MRLGIPELASAHPLGDMLPSMLQDDPFAMGLTAGLDNVLAPIISALDCIDAYIDPEVAPEDFLNWLAGWLGVGLDENWPLDARRGFVRKAAALYRIRGTVPGLKALVEAVTGGEAQIAETGGVAISQEANGPLPGEAQPRMTVRVVVDDPSTVSIRALDAAVAEEKPAYVVHQVEVVGR